MHQQQAGQVLELSKGKVASQHCCSPLPATDAHSNVSSLDHPHIIGTITNACSQSQFLEPQMVR